MISVFQPSLTFKDKFAVYKTLLKNNISGTSPIIEDFEKDISKKFQRKYGIAVSNGSVALDVAFQCLNLKKELFQKAAQNHKDLKYPLLHVNVQVKLPVGLNLEAFQK